MTDQQQPGIDPALWRRAKKARPEPEEA